jgi:intein/homing endonuclease
MWSLYKNNQELKPLTFSNGKSQKDLVKEITKAIKEGNRIIFLRGMCGTGKCLEKNTLIFCKPNDKKYFGYYKISNLVRKEGKIISLNNKGNLVESNFKNVRNTGKKSLYKIKTRTGREIIASKNHPFLTITSEGTKWKVLEKLNLNSYICLPNSISLNSKYNLEDNKIKVLAHLIAEGKLGDKSGSPTYFQCPKQNPLIRKDYEGALKNLFPEGELKSYSKNDVNIIFNNKDTRFGTTNKLRLFIRRYGLDGKKSNDKFVPKIIFNLEKTKIALFLSRLFSCDGSIYIKKKKGDRNQQITIEYYSISDRLIKDISILLLRFGIQHTITSKKFRNNSEYSRRITISNNKQVRKFIKKIGFIGRKQKLALELYKKTKTHKFTNIDKVPRIIRDYLKGKGHSYNELDRFLNYDEIENLRKNKGYKLLKKDKTIKTPCVFMQGKIDFLRSHLRTTNKYIKDNQISFICNKDIIWDKIKSIEYIKEEETYDLEVPENNNFIANGIIVHNSAIALNLARNFGKTSIVVPIKSLQEQYTKDYTTTHHILDKDNKKKLKIASIFGRSNFKCKFLEGSQLPDINRYYKEKDTKLSDIFAGIKPQFNPETDTSCNNNFLPCKIEIKEKNLPRIRDFIKQNPSVKITNFESVSDIKRMTIAPVCPYWSPIFPDDFEIKKFKDANKIKYTGLGDKKFTFYQRKKGCGYYDQYTNYSEADVLIFNSLKYKIESLMNRKPQTELEIIDECDDFLDSFANTEIINLNRLLFALGFAFSSDEESKKIIKEIEDITNTLKKKYVEPTNEIKPIKNTLIEELIKKALQNNSLLEEIEVDESSYLYNLDKVARTFSDFLDETFFSVEKKDNDIIIQLVTTNLEKRFQELTEKNKVFVMMSGTIHSEDVLKNIFGINNFKIIEAEIEHQGELIPCRHGYEIDCKYANFQSNKITREQYLKALSKTIDCAKKPALVHVNSFSDLPTDIEKINFNLINLPTQHELISQQSQDPLGQRIIDFKNKKSNILFTTKCNRGVDFPGDMCNSIIITRFPYPNISSIFWKVLKRNKPTYFMNFYMDKAKRELLQKIYRGLRSKTDRVYLLSPDIRVLDAKIN